MRAQDAPAHTIARAPHPQVPAHEALTLSSAAGLVATFVPTVGMVGSSLTDGGVELLGQRGGITDYLARGKTFGIPLLAPWANRLGAMTYTAAGRSVVLDDEIPGLHTDAAGLPMHGLFTACPDWRVVSATADDDAAVLQARLEHGPDSPRWRGFPFAHRLDVAVVLAGRSLTVTTALTATADHDVPVAFGWHPYLAPPEAPRASWAVTPPSVRRAVLDGRSIPTGEVVDDTSLAGPLGARTFDDLLADVAPGAFGTVVAGGRRVSVHYDRGYPWAVQFAPVDPQVVCLEAMTAPTDPFAGRFPIDVARPGAGPVVAAFTLEVPPVGSLS